MSLISGFGSSPRAKKLELARLLEEKERLFGNRLRRHRYRLATYFWLPRNSHQ